MALAFDSRRATRDVDALFEPHGIVHERALLCPCAAGVRRYLAVDSAVAMAKGLRNRWTQGGSASLRGVRG
jgi:hypothetical protein